MKKLMKYIFVGLICAFSLAACSKQPAQEINAAKAAVDSAIGEGAEKYAPAEAKKMNDALTSALEEVRKQENRVLKDYKKAKEMLSLVKAEADTLRVSLDEKKSAAKAVAETALESAQRAVEQTRTLLNDAKRRKSVVLEQDLVDADMKQIEESLAEVQKLHAVEDYNSAAEKAGLVREKTEQVSEKIREALKAPAQRNPSSGKPGKKH